MDKTDKEFKGTLVVMSNDQTSGMFDSHQMSGHPQVCLIKT